MVYLGVIYTIQFTSKPASHGLDTRIYSDGEDQAKAIALLDAPAVFINAITSQPYPQTVSTIHVDVDQRECSVVYAITDRLKKKDRFSEKIVKDIDEFIVSYI